MNYLLNAKNDSKMADVFISNSDWCTSLYRKSFWYNGDIKEYGSPRLDDFLSNKPIMDEKIRANLLEKGIRYILYAPTFRDKGNVSVYKLDYAKLIDNIKRKFGGDWKVLVRLHPNISNRSDIIEYSSNVLDATKYENIYDLIKISDICISDYSSWIFEAGLINKMVFLYAEDISQYEADRGCYFELDKLPFPLAVSNEEMVHNINVFERKDYLDQLSKFNEKLGVHESGKASKLSAELILTHMKV